jgi:predicted dehydrogenase
MGRGDLVDVLGHPEAHVIAVCDVDRRRAEDGKALVERIYAERRSDGSYSGCATHHDYRELVARDDLDAVLVCTPDHWHTLPALAAVRAGKDVFLQKPLTYYIHEGRMLSDAVRSYGRILQVGSQQRSDSRFRKACELVRNGRIGQLRHVKVGFGLDPGTTVKPVMPVPENLDYDMWLGPAPWTPYTEERVHPDKGYGRPGWLRIRDYSAGMITGWGSHHMDIAHWGMGMEYSGPVEIEGHATFPADGLWNVHGPFSIDYKYANGVTLSCAGDKVNRAGVTFEGDEGWVWVTRGAIDAHPKSLLDSVIGPDEVHLYQSRDHKGNWIECMRTRREPVAPVEIGHRSNSACLLGNISMLLDRKIVWDPKTESFPNDPEAARMVVGAMRAPYTI